MNYSLPTSIEVGGVEYPIRSDYRCALDIFAAMADPDLNRQDMAEVLLRILYVDFPDMPSQHWEEAVQKGIVFLSGGEEEEPGKKSPKLMDWEQDFKYIVAPINRVMGCDIRGLEYMHWWTFLSAYYEIGDCLFAQIVGIRDKKVRGKKLEKHEQEFYRKNRRLVDMKMTYSTAERELLKKFGIG